MISGDVSHDADAPGWGPGNAHCVTFTAAPRRRTAHSQLGRPQPLAPAASSGPDPARLTPTFPVVVNGSSSLAIAQDENIAVTLNNSLRVALRVAPIRKSCWLTKQSTSRPDRCSPPLLPHHGPGPPSPACFLLTLPAPYPPCPSDSRLHPVARRNLRKGKVIHVIPLLRRLQ